MKKLVILSAIGLLGSGLAIVLAGSSGAQRELGPQHVHVSDERLWVDDPAGGARWLALAYSNDGRTCLRYGPREDGRFIPAGGGGRQCPERSVAPLSAGISSGGSRGDESHTVVHGLAARGVERVTVTGPTGSTTFTFARAGLPYLVVYDGWVDPTAITVTINFADGRRRRLFGPPTHEVHTRDPDGGSPWAAMSGPWRFGARTGQTCVQFRRVQPRYGERVPSEPGKVVCGDLDADPFVVTTIAWDENAAPRRPGDPLSSDTPTHTILYGAAGPHVDAVTLRSPRGTERLPLSRRGRAFIAVFRASEVQRDELAVEFRLDDGTSRDVLAPLNVNRAGVVPESERRRPPNARRRSSRGRQGTCRTPGARTVLKTPRGIVQAVDQGDTVRYYACRYSGQAKSVIHTDAPGAPFLHPTLTSPYVAFVHGAGIAVKNIRSGESVRESRRDPSPGSVKALALTGQGHLAWITLGEDGAAVHVSDSRGERIAARGSIEADSLRRQGSRVFWTNAGEEQTEFLR